MQNPPSKNSHVSHVSPLPLTDQSPATQAIPADPPAPTSPPESVAERLIPKSVRELKFRTHSFVSQLTYPQRDILFAWIKALPTRQVVEKVAAPAPDGFGLQVSPTTIDRLRGFVKNMTPMILASDAMDTAADLLDCHQTADIAALHEALHLMLYSTAVKSAAQGADPKVIDQTLTALARLEKLRHLRSAREAARPDRSPSAPATRHHVHLTISPAHVEPAPPSPKRLPIEVLEP